MKLKTLTIAIALAATSASTFAADKEEGFYIGAFGDYYGLLFSQGDRYGQLALDVVNSSVGAGAIARAFAGAGLQISFQGGKVGMRADVFDHPRQHCRVHTYHSQASELLRAHNLFTCCTILRAEGNDLSQRSRSVHS
jgi:hypothetical protein